VVGLIYDSDRISNAPDNIRLKEIRNGMEWPAWSMPVIALTHYQQL